MPAPVAAYSATPTALGVGVAVSFTDQSTNTPTSWAWTFGDGATSTSQNPSHSYSAPGVYMVSLKATNASGNNTTTGTISVAGWFGRRWLNYLLGRRC